MTASAPAAVEFVEPRYASPSRFARSRGPSVVEFGETHLRTQKGPLAGEPLRFLVWQRWLLNELLELRDDGRLRYRRGLVGVGRQNGKSLLGSTLALEALVRGPIGCEVYSAAGDRQQARIVFREAAAQVASSPLLSSVCKVYRDVIEVPSRGSVYRTLSADAPRQQGLSPYLVLFDEVHVQRTEDLWDVLSLGMGALTEALIVGITTAGEDPESLCGRLYDYGRQVASGEIVDDSFAFYWWETRDADPDLFDPIARLEANPSLYEGLMVDEDFDVAARQQRPGAYRRYRLNQWVRIDQEAFVDPAEWAEIAVDSFTPPPEGTRIVAGFDGSVDRDATALVAIDLEAETAWPVRVWEPTGDEDWQVPRDEVEAAIESLMIRYDVAAIGADPAWWRAETQRWSDRWPGRIVEWPVTNARMAPACTSTYSRIRNASLRHAADATLTRHIENAVTKDLGSKGVTIKKEKRSSRRYIDAAVALVIAVDMMERYSQPEEEPPEVLFF